MTGVRRGADAALLASVLQYLDAVESVDPVPQESQGLEAAASRGPRGVAGPTAAPRRRVRLSREERLGQIVAVASRLISERGFSSLSLQDVAREVGITQAGLLHYVGTKQGLLQLIVQQGYDQRFDPDDFVATGDPAAVHPDGVSFPAYLRYLVANNARDPQLVRLYVVLGAEAIAEDHPAHDYFDMRPEAVWELYSRTTWRLPPEVGGWDGMRDLVQMAIAAMDGLQLRLFRSPAIDLVAAWATFERVLFPSPVWDDHR
ncbi:TetR/AcrR family transcriptional regulator [Puerhibacterium puerhi]|uniref:TetR/AcrR family transcriptional regulator n=1 Tax=Puerhibacterium puerhi TaxID=2692623 RepID=UPI001F24A012|nr:helix-turn-helix domain-containing protein [Puerhibacterium puerhi]